MSNIIFQPVRIRQLELKNRLMRSATGERMVEKTGAVTDELVKVYETLAKGGVGTIITGHSFVRPDGRSGWQMMGIHDDSMIKGLARLPKAVHPYETKIFVQLNHTGRYAPGAIIGTNPLAPSITEPPVGMYPPRAMTEADIAGIIKSFGDAAERAREAGFDGVQIHAAHGYLISQFLSPHANQRTDDWGGTPEKRAGLMLRVYQNIRVRLGKDFPVWIKLNCADFVEGGLTVEDSLVAALLLEKSGIDLIEISGGVMFNVVIRPGVGKTEPEAYFLPQAEQLRAKLKVPLSLVGGIRSLATMEMLVRDKGFNLVSLCRPLLREPDFVRRLQQDADTQTTCLSCNSCLRSRKDDPIICRAEANNHPRA